MTTRSVKGFLDGNDYKLGAEDCVGNEQVGQVPRQRLLGQGDGGRGFYEGLINGGIGIENEIGHDFQII